MLYTDFIILVFVKKRFHCMWENLILYLWQFWWDFKPRTSYVEKLCIQELIVFETLNFNIQCCRNSSTNLSQNMCYLLPVEVVQCPVPLSTPAFVA
jgi:hypothetical protein